jgi:hypothetical protein
MADAAASILGRLNDAIGLTAARLLAAVTHAPRANEMEPRACRAT